MASIRKRGRVWHVRYCLGGRQLDRTLETSDKAEAISLLAGFRAEEAAGKFVAPTRTPVDIFLDNHSEHLRLRHSRKSWKADMGRLRTFFSRANVSTLEMVTPGLISNVLEAGMRSGWAPSTYNNYLEVINRAFSYAIREKGLFSPFLRRTNPASLVLRMPVPAPKIRFLSLSEIDALLERLAHNLKLQTATAMLIYAGLRRSEVLWLTVKDVDLEKRRIMIRAKEIDGEFWQSKSRSNRSVPISSDLWPHLQQWMSTSRESIWLFPNRLGLRWGPDNFSTFLRDAQADSEPRWNCLDLRHTFASHLALKGVSLYKIAKLLGNSARICQRHYAHLSAEWLAEDVEFRE